MGSQHRPSRSLRGAMASKALNQMLWDTEWGNLDLLIDLPPGTGDIHLH